MRLLVTGSAGFIGSAFVRLVLDEKLAEKVLSYDALTYAGKQENLGPAMTDKRHTFYSFTFGKNIAWEGPRVANMLIKKKIDTIVHFAAETHVDRSIGAPAVFMHSNILGTYSVLEAIRAAAREGQNTRLVHVSTDEVYGDREVEGAAGEDEVLRPSSPYSASKASSDLMVLAYARTYGVNAVVTRCTNNYGPRQNAEKMIPTILAALEAQMPVPVYGDGHQSRDWIHVEDHCRALLAVMEHGKLGTVYNIGTGISTCNVELIEILARVAECERTVTVRHVADRPGHDRRYAVRLEKIHSLGWRAQISLEDGLARTVKWYREERR